MSDFLLMTLMSTLVGILVPASRDNGMKKGISFLAALALILAVAVPVSASFARLSELPTRFLSLFLPDTETIAEMESQAKEWVMRYSVENIESSAAALIENRYSLEKGTVKVTAFTETESDGTVLLRRLRVFIDSGIFREESVVAEYVGNVLACPCEVIISP